ncbi:sensor histidine kinase [Cryobacterium sp. HLT2-28]|uniref:sensor histidine kinase n=1 Tax=Cryobacterium sp. HLT2-28 TaxID=1259146 RepID=UPI00141BB110|nr:ATP-binding protein [Cryobacterium sp. HLT2-28]
MVDVTGDRSALGRLEPGVDHELGLAVQQCLINVILHAGIVSAEVDIGADDGTVSVMVMDAGRGFTESETGADRLGLRQAVRRRIERLGGSVTVLTRPDAGTSVLLSVPASTESASVTGPASVTNPASVTGPASVTNPASVTGPASVTNPASVTGPASVTNPASVTGPASVTNPAAVTGPASVTNPAAVTGPASVTNPAAVTGPASVTNPASVTGPAAATEPASVTEPVETPAEPAEPPAAPAIADGQAPR